MDTWVRVSIGICLAMAVNLLWMPWFALPELEYQGLNGGFTLWNVEQSVALARRMYGIVLPQLLQVDDIAWGMIWLARIGGGLAAAGLVASAGLTLVWRGKATGLVRVSAAVSLLPVVGAVGAWVRLSQGVNAAMGSPNTFWSMTVFSHMQLTGFACMQLALAILLLVKARRWLDTQGKEYALAMPSRPGGGRRSTRAAWVLLCAIPLLIAFGIVFLQGRSYYFISVCIILLALLVFARGLEQRRPQAREMVLIASMVVIATAGRAAFFMLPHFKPVTALVIVAGVGLGAEAGFLTGALTGFVSNFLFGQGPWTPWQMFAFGVIGFLAGVFFSRAEERGGVSRLLLCAYGGVATVAIYGLLMDTSTALSVVSGLSWEGLMACYIAGVPVNLTHGVATVLCLALVAHPMLKKIRRIRKKYGILFPSTQM